MKCDREVTTRPEVGMSDKTPTPTAVNEQRLIANQICRELYEQGAIEQLRLLRAYIDAAIRELNRK